MSDASTPPRRASAAWHRRARGYDSFTLREIWNGDAYRAFRHGLLSDDPPCAYAGCGLIIRSCNMGGVALIIPVINEGETIAAVARDIPRDVVDVVIVVDGGSTDMTVAHTRQAHSLVIVESQSGWGAELLAGIRSAPVDFLSPQKPRWRPMRPRIRLYRICLARRTWWANVLGKH